MQIYLYNYPFLYQSYLGYSSKFLVVAYQTILCSISGNIYYMVLWWIALDKIVASFLLGLFITFSFWWVNIECYCSSITPVCRAINWIMLSVNTQQQFRHFFQKFILQTFFKVLLFVSCLGKSSLFFPNNKVFFGFKLRSFIFSCYHMKSF